MNVERVFRALNEDDVNSALGVFCYELENQGYVLEIEGIFLKSNEIFQNKFPSLEEVIEPLNIKIYKDGIFEQKFSISFTEYHKIIFQEFIND